MSISASTSVSNASSSSKSGITATLLIIVAILIALEAAAQSSLQFYTNLKKPDYLYLVLGFILYGTLGLVYQRMLASGQTLILANIIWQGATVVAMGIIGYFVFGQTLTTKETIATVGILLLMLLLK
jgi:uncharacterized membrane protein